MSPKPFISVIIPVYQASDYIEDCLQSVVAQDYTGKIECILVDDCGTDDSMDKARCFAASYGGPVMFRFTANDGNKGAAAARNTGIRLAAGDYIFFLDSDDRISSDALSSLSLPLSDKEYDMVMGRYANTGLFEGVSTSLPDGSVLNGREILDCLFARKMYVGVINKLIRTSFIRDNQLFFHEGIIFEDDLWSFRVAVLAASMYVVGRITYVYLVREGSVMTSTALQRKIFSFQTVMSEMFAFACTHNLRGDAAFHNRFEQYRLNLFRMLMPYRAEFRQAYVDLRRMIPKTWTECARMDRWRINKQIRDFHLALPPAAGALYMRLWLKLESAFRKQEPRSFV